jgi:hypothetical protein
MATRKMKRYEEGGDIDEMEEANNRAEMTPRRVSLPPRALKEMGDASAAEEAGQFGDPGTSRVIKATPKKPKAQPRDTGSDVGRMLARFPKPALRAETNDDRAKAFVAKRAAARAEAAAADKSPKGQDRILTGIKKKSDVNKFMGSTGMKSGGKVSSASKRADGCAIRGKTRA